MDLGDLSLGSFDAWVGLPLLALIDATSVGTLVIPLMLLVTGASGARSLAARTAGYLAMIGAFYWVLGVALLAGLLPLYRSLLGVVDSLGARIALVLVGIGLLVWSWAADPATIRKRGGDPEASARRWVGRVQRASTSWRALATLAVAAGTIEAASMVPYLGAMGILADSGMGLLPAALLLVGYCGVMIAPGLALAGLRALAGPRADAQIARLEGWAVRHASSAFAWGIGIVGVLILVRTVPRLVTELHGLPLGLG